MSSLTVMAVKCTPSASSRMRSAAGATRARARLPYRYCTPAVAPTFPPPPPPSWLHPLSTRSRSDAITRSTESRSRSEITRMSVRAAGSSDIEAAAAQLPLPAPSSTSPAFKAVQAAILQQVAAAIVISAAAIWWGATRAPAWLLPRPGATSLDLLSYGIITTLPMSLMVLQGIAAVGMHRLVSPVDADAAASPYAPSKQVVMLQAMLTNTVEQVVWCSGVRLAWSLTMPPHLAGVLAVTAALFVASRQLFRAGYAAGARGRAPGFALGFDSHLILAVWLVGHHLVRGVTKVLAGV